MYQIESSSQENCDWGGIEFSSLFSFSFPIRSFSASSMFSFCMLQVSFSTLTSSSRKGINGTALSECFWEFVTLTDTTARRCKCSSPLRWGRHRSEFRNCEERFALTATWRVEGTAEESFVWPWIKFTNTNICEIYFGKRLTRLAQFIPFTQAPTQKHPSNNGITTSARTHWHAPQHAHTYSKTPTQTHIPT